MRSVLAVVLCLATSVLSFASEGGYKVSYDGGSITSLKAGEHMKLFMDGDHIRIAHDNADVPNVPASA